MMADNFDVCRMESKSFVARNFWALIVYGLIGGFVMICVFGQLRNNRLKGERALRTQVYLVDHQCRRTGFAGKDAVPTYQCDNGLWLHTEIYRFANPEWEP